MMLKCRRIFWLIRTDRYLWCAARLYVNQIGKVMDVGTGASDRNIQP